MKQIMLAALSMALCSGCMWSRAKMNDPSVSVRAKSIKVGETDSSDLKELLKAEPSMKLPTGNGTMLWAYTYSDTKTKGASFIVVNFAKTNSRVSTLYVEVDDASGKVKGVHIPNTDEPEWEFWPFED